MFISITISVPIKSDSDEFVDVFPSTNLSHRHYNRQSNYWYEGV